MGNYFIGTAGWSYEDWEGIVYPEKKGPQFHPLPYLAQYINMIEINSTFYRPPSIYMSISWIKRIESFPDFLFSVKLHQVFTHQRKGFTHKDVDTFKIGIDPLAAKSRLASLLIQFPWSFVNTTAHMDYLTHLFGLFSGYPLALEVRHSSWDNPDFLSLLLEHKVCFCNIDQPVLRNSIKPSAIITNPKFSYVRLHGRNYKDWFREGAGRDERYDYLYTKEELTEWVQRIKDLGGGSDKVYVITNNHYRGQALANALQIKNMITGEKLDIPLPLLKKYPVLEDIVDKIKEGQLDLFETDRKK
ncbi:MAG: DUF72 domain-containing protein [Candidatus Aminicenantales bacterium]